MDITKSNNKIFSTKAFNSQTVGYTALYFFLTLGFLVVKQIFKLGFNVSAQISMLISFLVFEAACQCK